MAAGTLRPARAPLLELPAAQDILHLDGGVRAALQILRGRAEWRAGVDPKKPRRARGSEASLRAPSGRRAGGGVPRGLRVDGIHAADKAVLAFVTNESVEIFGGAAALERTRAAVAAAGHVLEVNAS